MQCEMDLHMKKIFESDIAADLRVAVGSQRYACLLADPPWQFINRTGKVAPEH